MPGLTGFCAKLLRKIRIAPHTRSLVIQRSKTGARLTEIIFAGFSIQVRCALKVLRNATPELGGNRQVKTARILAGLA